MGGGGGEGGGSFGKKTDFTAALSSNKRNCVTCFSWQSF